MVLPCYYESFLIAFLPGLRAAQFFKKNNPLVFLFFFLKKQLFKCCWSVHSSKWRGLASMRTANRKAMPTQLL